jgi:hypothetical protein
MLFDLSRDRDTLLLRQDEKKYEPVSNTFADVF